MRFLFFIAGLFLLGSVYSQSLVYFGSFNWNKSLDGLYVYKLDQKKGKLKRITALNGVVNPSYITLSPDGKFLYACTETKTTGAGKVSAFKLRSSGKKIKPVNSQPSGGENPVYLSVHRSGRWLVNANYTEGSISVYPLKLNGSIDSIAQHFPYTQGSVDFQRQDRAHLHAAVFAPDNKYVFFPDLGADVIRAFSCDPNDRLFIEPTQQGVIKTSSGSGPRHLVFHPNGKFAYCIEELSGTISIYKYTDGLLEFLERASTHPEPLSGGFASSDLQISPDGLFLYAANRGEENNITIFSITPKGTLMLRGYQETHGVHPRSFAIDQSGKFLIVTNVESSNAVVFKRDFKTGKLQKTDEKLIRNVSCVKFAVSEPN